MNNTNTSIITLNEGAQAVREHPVIAKVDVFNFGDAEVRTVTKDGEAWFVANDVCAVLNIDRTQVRRLDEDEKGVYSIHTPGGKQDMNVVSEPGLYKLIFTSNKPEAKSFKRWVTHDVLPTIRRQGYYSAIPDEELFNAIKNKLRLGDGSFRDGMQVAEREVRNERWVETEMMWNNRGDLTLLNVDERVAEIWKDDREMYAKAKSHVRGLLREDMRTAGWLPWKKCVWATKKPSNKGDDSPEVFFRVADIEGGCTIRDLKRMLHELEELKARVMSAI